MRGPLKLAFVLPAIVTLGWAGWTIVQMNGHGRMLFGSDSPLRKNVRGSELTKSNGSARTTYYVDNVCSDNGDGLSKTCASSAGTAGPFNSIANADAKVIGDQHGNFLLLRRGETFREEMNVAASGTAAARFTIGSYGNGPNPIISGAELLRNWTVEAQTSTDFMSDANLQLYSRAEKASGEVQAHGSSNYNELSNDNGVSTSARNPWLMRVDMSTSTSIWHKVGGVWDGNPTFRVDVSRVLQTLWATGCPTLPTSTYPIEICYAGNGYLNVSADVALVFDRAPPASEIQSIYTWDLGKTGKSYNLYYASATAKPAEVILDGSSRLVYNATSKEDFQAGQWWWDSTKSRVYVRLPGDAYPSAHTLEGSQRSFAVTSAKSYVRYENLSLTLARNVGFFQNGGENSSLVSVISSWNADGGFEIRGNNITLVRVSASHNEGTGIGSESVTGLELLDSKSTYNGGNGVQFNGTSSARISGGEFSHNGSTAKEGNGINILGTTSNGDAHDITVTGVLSHDNQGNGIDLITSGGTGVFNIIISKSSFYNNARGPGLCSGVRLDTLTHASVVSYVRSYQNESAGVVVEDGSYDNRISYNLLYSNNNGITHSNKPGPGNVYYNNTAYDNTVDGFAVDVAVNPAIMENNIIYKNGRYGYSTDGSDRGESTVDYNVVYGNATADYKGIAKPAHDINSDPLFTNASADNFTVRPGSPAIDAGVNLGPTFKMGLLPGSAWPSNVLLGSQNDYGAGWEAGAYVYVPWSGKPSMGGEPACGPNRRMACLQSCSVQCSSRSPSSSDSAMRAYLTRPRPCDCSWAGCLRRA